MNRRLPRDERAATVGDGQLFIFVSHRLLDLPVGR